ncbi:MAG: hypothetical protein HMLKMBBP_00447 [Planctomycetes bacterium]|nr:hypothetical protein [Planctomycetota bacterium]
MPRTNRTRTTARAAALVLAVVFPVLAAHAAEDPAPQDAEKTAATILAQAKSEAGKASDAASRDSIARIAALLADAAVSPATKRNAADVLLRYTKDFDRPSIVSAALDAFTSAPPDLGARGVLDVLGRVLKQKDPHEDLVNGSFRALKRLADPSKSTLDAIFQYLKHRDDEVVSRACDALSGYASAPGASRRAIFEELVKHFEGVFNGSQQSDMNARRKWGVVGSNVVAALNATSGVSHANPAAARQWLNENKKNEDVWK